MQILPSAKKSGDGRFPVPDRRIICSYPAASYEAVASMTTSSVTLAIETLEVPESHAVEVMSVPPIVTDTSPRVYVDSASSVASRASPSSIDSSDSVEVTFVRFWVIECVTTVAEAVAVITTSPVTLAI